MHPFVKLVWILAGMLVVYQTIDVWTLLRIAETAPQQAAVSAMGAFYVVAAYVLARVVESIAAPPPDASAVPTPTPIVPVVTTGA